MKKIQMIFSVFLIICASSNLLNAQADNQYHVFTINDLRGITDSLGREHIPPSYSGTMDNIYAKKQWIFFNPTSKRRTIFNRLTGDTSSVEKMVVGRLKYCDTFYSYVENKNLNYLLSEESDKKIYLNKKWNFVNAEGCFFFLKEIYFPKSKPPYMNKKGKWVFPPTPNFNANLNRYDFYQTMKQAKPTLSIIAKEYITYRKSQDISVDAYPNNAFDYIVFINTKDISIYDRNLQIIKKLNISVSPNSQLEDTLSSVLGEKLSRAKQYPVMGFGRNDAFPRLDVTKDREGIYHLYILENSDTKKEVLSSTHKIIADRKVYIYDGDGDNNIAAFDVNPKSGIVYLPRKYYSSLKIQSSNN